VRVADDEVILSEMAKAPPVTGSVARGSQKRLQYE
jgi:hypothetical protein